MKVLNSLKSARQRHPDCQVVRRRGRMFVICKTNPRFKAVQGRSKKTYLDTLSLSTYTTSSLSQSSLGP